MSLNPDGVISDARKSIQS